VIRYGSHNRKTAARLFFRHVRRHPIAGVTVNQRQPFVAFSVALQMTESVSVFFDKQPADIDAPAGGPLQMLCNDGRRAFAVLCGYSISRTKVYNKKR